MLPAWDLKTQKPRCDWVCGLRRLLLACLEGLRDADVMWCSGLDPRSWGERGLGFGQC